MNAPTTSQNITSNMIVSVLAWREILRSKREVAFLLLYQSRRQTYQVGNLLLRLEAQIAPIMVTNIQLRMTYEIRRDFQRHRLLDRSAQCLRRDARH